MPKQKRMISRSELLDLARELKSEFGEALTLLRFRNDTGLSSNLVCRYFNSWGDLRVVIGLARRPPRIRNCRLTDEGICDLLRRHSEERQGAITQAEFLRLTGIGYAEIYERFGSWRELRQSAGLPRRAKCDPNYSEEDLLADMLQVYLKTGRLPSACQYRRWGGKVSPSTLRLRYGNWRGVKARFELHRREYFTKLDPNWTPQTPYKPPRGEQAQKSGA